MGRMVIAAIAAVGTTAATWASYSSPLLQRITKSCGGMLRTLTGRTTPTVADTVAVRLSHSFAIRPLRNFILTLLTWRKETNRTTDTDPSERTLVLRGRLSERMPSFVLRANLL
jgi:hypothetical protein